MLKITLHVVNYKILKQTVTYITFIFFEFNSSFFIASPLFDFRVALIRVNLILIREKH